MEGSRRFDEINEVNFKERSEPYEEYFGNMDLSERQKENRISLAERFEKEFLNVLMLGFTLQEYGKQDWEHVRIEFASGYISALDGYVEADTYIQNYVDRLSYDVIEATISNLDNPYYFSFDRARFMAENESNTSLNYQEFMNAIRSGKTRKTWIDIRDKKERDTHRKVGGKTKPIAEPYIVGDSIMMFPKDNSFEPEAKEIVNCRCTIKYF